MKIIKNALIVILSYFSMIFPRNRKLCVFGAWFGDKFLDNTKYLFLDFEKRDLVCIWITKNKDVYNMLLGDNHKVYMANSLKGIFYQLHAKYVFICTGFSDINEALVGNSIIINFWHGVPLKKIMYDNKHLAQNRENLALRTKLLSIPRRNYFVVSTSEFYDSIFANTFNRDEKHILKMGYPRNDVFFDNLQKGILRERFNGKKIIVYMPTHRNSGKVHLNCEELFDFEELNQLCLSNNIMFIIKKHYYHRAEETKGNYSNILDITKENLDPQQLLLSADILISDYSGAYIDYLLLDRPIVFYIFDYEKYTSEDRELYFDFDKVTPGFKAHNYSELYMELQRLINGEDKWKKERLATKNVFFRKEAQKPVSQMVYDYIKYNNQKNNLDFIRREIQNESNNS